MDDGFLSRIAELICNLIFHNYVTARITNLIYPKLRPDLALQMLLLLSRPSWPQNRFRTCPFFTGNSAAQNGVKTS